MIKYNNSIMPCLSAPLKLTILSSTPPIVSDRAARSSDYLSIGDLKIRNIIEGRENVSDIETIKLEYDDIDDDYYYYHIEYNGFTSRIYKTELSRYKILRSSKSSISPLVALYADCITKGSKPKRQRKSRRKSRKSKKTRRK